MKHKIPESLQELAFPIEKLVHLPGNPHRGHDASMAESLDEFGQPSPIVAKRLEDGRGMVLAGNTRLRAARDILEWTHIAVSWVDEWSDDKANAYAIRDNLQGKMGEDDDLAMAALLASIEDDDLLEATGFGWDELMAYDAMIEEEPPELEAPEIPSGFEELEPTRIEVQAPPSRDEEEEGEEEGEDEDEEEPPARLEAPAPRSIIQTTIIFDDVDQKSRWYAFIKDLRERFPDGETVAARLDAYLEGEGYPTG